MKLDEMLERERVKHQPKKHGDAEAQLQAACVLWFRMQYRDYASLLFAVPNGGSRNRAEAAKMKAQGVTAGVSDLIRLVGRGQYNALCIEMKTPTGTQQQVQKDWQQIVELAGSKYVVCRSLDEFMNEINNYLKTKEL